MRVDDEAGVLAANAIFYEAFDQRDVAAMERLWARRVPVACIHPGWAPLFGRDDVLKSWHAILTGPGAPRISCTDPVVHALGDGSALVVCVEVLPGGAMVATNVFVREDGAWRMVQHHAGPVAGLSLSDDGGERTVH
jgi:ketosteroid isomerase-like protein